MRAIYLAVVGLSLLGILSVHAAPVNVTGNKTGFMEVLYSNLSKRNLSTWIFPPKEDTVNKSVLFQQVDKSCQNPSSDHTDQDSEMSPIYYACASMLETIDDLWETPKIVQLIEDKEIQLPSKLEDLYKEEDLKNASEFCDHFSKILNTDDFNANLSKFLVSFMSNETSKKKERGNCKSVCLNPEDKSIIYPGDVNPVCAIWRKGYYIYKLVTGKKSEEKKKTENLKPDEAKKSVESKISGLLQDAEEEENQADETADPVRIDTSTKKRMFVSPDTDGQGLATGAVTSKGKSLSKKPVLPEKVKSADIDETADEDEKLATKDAKPSKNVTDQKDKTVAAEHEDKKANEEVKGDKNANEEAKEDKNANEEAKEDKNANEEVKDKKLPATVPKKTNDVPPAVSSSTQSSNLVAEGEDPPMPPVNKDQAPSSPKPVENTKDKPSSVSKTSKQPESKTPDASLRIPKVEQNQNEAPPPEDYEEPEVQPPSDKGRIDDATDDDSALEVVDQNRKKPKPSYSSSVSVSKEKHAGDNVEFDKVSIEGDSATVNVEFNEQSDPGVINYFVAFLGLLAVLYLLFHNKKRLIAYVVEGRKPQSGRRRSSSTQYRKLENNYD